MFTHTTIMRRKKAFGKSNVEETQENLKKHQMANRKKKGQNQRDGTQFQMNSDTKGKMNNRDNKIIKLDKLAQLECMNRDIDPHAREARMMIICLHRNRILCKINGRENWWIKDVMDENDHSPP